ncbi:hypothetical protein NMY22_g2006 [Coprinellus aureogranulatus]|nr:hypothetical protein NMY22_g2006 [Coprinellus aureogranulatus]
MGAYIGVNIRDSTEDSCRTEDAVPEVTEVASGGVEVLYLGLDLFCDSLKGFRLRLQRLRHGGFGKDAVGAEFEMRMNPRVDSDAERPTKVETLGYVEGNPGGPDVSGDRDAFARAT